MSILRDNPTPTPSRATAFLAIVTLFASVAVLGCEATPDGGAGDDAARLMTAVAIPLIPGAPEQETTGHAARPRVPGTSQAAAVARRAVGTSMPTGDNGLPLAELERSELGRDNFRRSDLPGVARRPGSLPRSELPISDLGREIPRSRLVGSTLPRSKLSSDLSVSELRRD